MITQIFEKQEKVKAKKQYEENISKISDLDDVCNTIDDLKHRISNIDYENCNKHMKELSYMQDEIIEQMRICEEENIERLSG